MKIQSPDQMLKPMPGLRNTGKTLTGGRTFTEALGRALEPDAAAPAPTPGAPPGPVSIRGIQFTGIPRSAPVSVTENVDRLLDLLEGYRQQLADPQRSLKSIGPQIDRVESDTLALERRIQNLDDADALKPIAQEALITATAEVFKFKRGDYNPE